MKRIIFTLFVIFFSVQLAISQNETHALRYSQLYPGGTARFTSMGGAFGALGGDFSTLSLNPAGLGVYRSSEITLTPALTYNQVETRYFGSWEDDMKYNFNLNNIGAVFSFSLGNEGRAGGWRFFNLGIGVNRHNNFNQRWAAEGFNTENSLMTSMLEQANREGSVENLDDFSTGLAWDTYLLDMFEGDFFVDMPDGQVLQRQETNSAGSIREVVLSAAANYNDRVYIGATIGFPSLRHEEESIFRESDNQNASQYFNSLTYSRFQETGGTGINFKFGAIFRITDMIRIGGAFHSPTFYENTIYYNATMRSDLNLDDYTQVAQSPRGRFEYEVTTPLRAMGSLGLVFGTTGILSIDYEYADYSKMRFRSNEFYGFSDENRTIRESFTAQHSIRAGGELRLSPVILRAGVSHSGSPYITGVNDGAQTALSAGIGFREQYYFVDFAYTYAFHSEDYYLYTLDNLRPVEREFNASTFRLTVGWRF